MTDDEQVFRRPARWRVLLAYTLVAGISQMLWLNFGALLTLVQSRYHVSELLASVLLLAFPLLYVVFSIPAGTLTDTRGYRYTVGWGAAAMAVFSCVRIYDGSFWALLAGQMGIAVAQPFVLNGISKLVADWFSEEQGAIATGLGTMGMFLGMAVGIAVTPAVVDATSLRTAMAVFAVITVASGALFAAVVHPNERNVAAPTAAAASGVRALLRNPRLVVLFALGFVGIGVFNGVTTWLEQILAPHGISAQRAGLVGGAMIVGGIVGAAVIPALSDLSKRRKPFLVVCAAVALATVYPLCTSASYGLLLGLAVVHGFFIMPAIALLLEMCTQIVGVRSAGAATSLLMWAGNAGAVVVIVAMPVIKGSGRDYHAAVLLLVVLLALTLVLALLAPETFVRAAPASASAPAPAPALDRRAS